MTQPIYAIGDIHGELDLLKQAIAKIDADGGPDARIIFLGDYIDRGPDSRGVIEYLMTGLDAGRNWVCLMGNHDQMFSMFMEDYPRTHVQCTLGYYWLHDRLGGKSTLASYGYEVDPNNIILNIHNGARAVVPRAHVDFLDNRPRSHVEDDILFVHAGIRPEIPIHEQDPEDFLWIREEFHDYTGPHPHLIVHGHTPVPAARHYGNRVNLDTGCGYGKPLTTAVFHEDKVWLLTETGRKLLLPDA